ncbi:MAG TPA: ABC transporter permease [Vicinamibacterales bacterium]|nr:ABC transporter permease [Vicinamibacterales bacterium]
MPDWKSEIRNRLSNAGLQPAREHEIVEEFAQHLEDRYQEAIARGAREADAEAAARREIDAGRLAREIARVMADPLPPLPIGRPFDSARGRPGPRHWMNGFWQDIRYAGRTLRRSPGFAAAATLTIALSTGPTIAAVGVANWLFFRPLPGVVAPDRVGIVWFGSWEDGSFGPSFVSYGHVAAIQAGLTTISGLTGQQQASLNVSLDNAPPRVVPGSFVMGNFFDVLGVRFLEGRGFGRDEDRTAHGDIALVLSADLARSLFPDGPAVGRIVRINGHDCRVVGVARQAFRGTKLGRSSQLWLPGLASPRINHAPPERWTYPPERGPFYEFLARLAPDATFAQADAELRASALALAAGSTPGAARFRTVQPFLIPEVGLDVFARDSGWTVTRPLLIVGVLLVVLGAANVANLFVFRGVTRGREAAVRRALGASGSRLARLHLVESLIVSSVGAILGVAVTAGGKAWLDGANVPGVGALEIVIDWRLLAIALSIAAGVGVLLSVAPARMATRTDLTSAMGRGSRGASRSSARLRTGLAVVQLAVSVVLLVEALLFIRTLQNLRNVDLGIDLRGVTTFMFASRGQGYTPARTLQFHRDLLERVGHLPAIDAVATSGNLPIGGVRHGARVLPPDQAAATLGKPNREAFQAALRILTNDVTPGYFETFGMRFLAGRTFTETEAYTAGAEPAVIISASLAQRLYGTTHAVGRPLTFPAQGSLPRHDAPVVGVVNDVRWGSPTDKEEFLVYRPVADSAGLGQILAVRSSARPADVVRLVQAEVSKLDPALPMSRDRTLAALLDERLTQQRLNAWALAVLAALAFLLAAIGIHGLVSQTVADRLREFGIRLAVGASRPQVMRLVLRSALLIIAIGAPLGLLLAGLGSQLVESRLFGVRPLDAMVYAVASLALAAVVVLASLGPAWRASRVDPVNVLRVE